MKKLLLSITLFTSVFLYSQTVSVDFNTTYQTIDGFGGFGPKKVWWDECCTYHDQEYIDYIVDDLGASIVRTQLYYDFELSNDNNDPNSINWDGFNFGPYSSNGKQFPFIRDLAEKGDIKQIASIWTPPSWMKTYDDASRIADPLPWFCGYNDFCGGQLNLSYIDEFAEYCLAYLQLVEQETGVQMYGLSLQNELRYPNPFEACVYMPGEMAPAIAGVGERLKNKGLQTLLFGPEDMAQSGPNGTWVNSILRDNIVAREYLDIWAVHGYIDNVAADYGNASGWNAIYEQVSKYDKPIWMTETSDGENSGWSLAWDMARGLHLALKHGKISAWVYWYMSGNLLGDSNTPQPLFYTFKHYYKNVRPGAVMVDCQCDDSDILSTAYTDGDNQQVTIVLINNSSSEKTISLDFGDATLPSNFQLISTTDGNHYDERGTVSNNSFFLPDNSINTIIYQGTSSPPTLDPIESMWMLASDGQQTINLSGIGDGDSGGQNIEITAVSSNPTLISNPTVSYASPNSTGTLTFEPNAGQSGKTTISVILKDNGDAVGGLNQRIVTFNVTVLPYINAAPTVDGIEDQTVYIDDPLKTIELTNLSDGNDETQNISVVAESQVFAALEVGAIIDGDKIQVFFNGKIESDIPVTITLKDDGEVDMGGVDTRSYTFMVHVLPGSNPVETGLSTEKAKEIMVYPNPASNLLFIDSGNKQIDRIIISDLSGRNMLDQKLNLIGKTELNISELEKGIYFIQFYNGNNKTGARNIIIE